MSDVEFITGANHQRAREREWEARRKALPLTEDENGVRRKHVGKINEAESREN